MTEEQKDQVNELILEGIVQIFWGIFFSLMIFAKDMEEDYQFIMALSGTVVPIGLIMVFVSIPTQMPSVALGTILFGAYYIIGLIIRGFMTSDRGDPFSIWDR